MTDLFANTHRLLDNHAPLVTKLISVVDKAPWFDSEYKKLRVERRKAERIWKHSRSPSDKITYKDISSECTKLANLKKKKYFSNMIAKAEGNPKTLYKLVNKELDNNQNKSLPDFTDDISELAAKFNSFLWKRSTKLERVCILLMNLLLMNFLR